MDKVILYIKTSNKIGTGILTSVWAAFACSQMLADHHTPHISKVAKKY